MAKATKTTPVKEEQLITLTKEQYSKLLSVRARLDSLTDILDDIDGDSNLFEIGKTVGAAYSEAIDAYNELSEVVVDKMEEVSEDDKNEEWTFA